MGLLSSIVGGLGGTSGSSAADYGYSNSSSNNSGLRATEFNREMMQQQMAYNAAEAEKARQFSAEQAAIARNWQHQETSTAYQRAVEDMKKAGINPILAASRGGAESGAGAMAGGFSASASQAQGATDYSSSSENWGNSSAYSYSNLAEALKSAFEGLSGLATNFSINVGDVSKTIKEAGQKTLDAASKVVATSGSKVNTVHRIEKRGATAAAKGTTNRAKAK